MHIAIIMDGNGRWAKRQGLPRYEGHLAGAVRVREITEECARLNLEQLTLYCFSSENWKRPQEEVDALMTLLLHHLVSERSTIIDNNVRLSIIGRRSGFSDRILAEMDRTIGMSENNTGLRLCLALNYGSRGEIVDAVKKIVQEGIDPDKIDEDCISNHLYTAGMPDPDLLIRTAGEMRLSNYLLWQLSYAEIWVTEKCWPDFDIPLFHQALENFSKRERRYGGLEQIETV